MNTLLLASFQAGLLAVAVLLLERCAGRWLTPGMRLALWALVPLRLVLVFPISDPLGATRPDWWTWQSQAPVAETNSPGAHEPDRPASQRTAPRMHHMSRPEAQPATPGSPFPPPADSAPPVASSSPTPSGPAGPVLPVATELVAEGASLEIAPATESSSIWQRAQDWVLAIWALGFLVALLRTIRAERSLRAHLDASTLPAAEQLQALADACAQQLGMTTPIPVRIVEGLPSPAAHGWRRGQLLLPLGIAEELEEEELRFVLLHELAHLRHRDALQNLVLALIGAMHWFNPLVAHAHHRIREERELLRDREALAALPHVPARRCAATLVKLLPRQQPTPPRTSLSALVPHHRTTRRRISMIIQPWQPKRLQLLPGVACLAVLAWAGLTHTQAQSSQSPGPAGPSTPSVGSVPNSPSGPGSPFPKPQIRVTRQTPEPSWFAPTLARIQAQSLRWDDPIELSMLAEMIEAVTELEVRVDEDLLHEFDEFCALRVTTSIDRALDLLAQVYPMRWTIEEGGIALEAAHDEPSQIELRFYDVRDLMDGDEDRGTHLQDVLHELTYHGEVWDWQDVGMQLWNGQLLVQQTPAVHARIEEILNMLLDRKSPAIPATPAAHLAVFQQRVIVPEGTQVDTFLAEVFARAEIPFLVHPDYIGIEFESDHENVPLHAVLAEMLSNYGGTFTYHEGVVYFGENVPMSTACYEISDLVQATDQEIQNYLEGEDGDHDNIAAEIRGWKAEQLMGLLYDMIDSEMWEIEGPSMLVWDDLLLITQSNRAHSEIASFLETARRAVRR